MTTQPPNETRLIADHRLDLASLPGARIKLFERCGERAVVVESPTVVRPGEPVLLRLQSACMYGEVLQATDCDCRDQLMRALDAIRAGGGYVIHLDQEGRGAGLLHKAQAYSVQQRLGLDTVDAYERLNLEPDGRDYMLAIEILRILGIDSVLVLTNNPRKVAALANAGLNAERVPLQGTVTDSNRAYLAVKELKLGHALDLLKPVEPTPDSCPVVIVGAAVTDHLFRTDTSPRLGQARQAFAYERRPGGKGFNQAVAFSRLGANVSLIAEVGTDADSVALLDALRRERVNAQPVQSYRGATTAQTVILQPQDHPATFVGWLGHDRHRALTDHDVERFGHHMAAARIVSMTLEVSESALCRAINRSAAESLLILNASPAAEGSYTVSTVCLEKLHVIVGSPTELRALAGLRTPEEPGDSVEENVACALNVAKVFEESLIVVTSLRQADRYVVAASSLLDAGEPLVVESPSVRVTTPDGISGISTSIGNVDVFCAALSLALIEALNESPGLFCGWRSLASPLTNATRVADVLLFATQAESFVARAPAGFEAFPHRDELDEWRRNHPSQVRRSS